MSNSKLTQEQKDEIEKEIFELLYYKDVIYEQGGKPYYSYRCRIQDSVETMEDIVKYIKMVSYNEGFEDCKNQLKKILSN